MNENWITELKRQDVVVVSIDRATEEITIDFDIPAIFAQRLLEKAIEQLDDDPDTLDEST